VAGRSEPRQQNRRGRKAGPRRAVAVARRDALLRLLLPLSLRSNLFEGVGEDAAYIAEHRTADTCREVCTDAVYDAGAQPAYRALLRGMSQHLAVRPEGANHQ
jgi:hypothetical protein